jgi:hypothetical protein
MLQQTYKKQFGFGFVAASVFCKDNDVVFGGFIAVGFKPSLYLPRGNLQINQPSRKTNRETGNPEEKGQTRQHLVEMAGCNIRPHPAFTILLRVHPQWLYRRLALDKRHWQRSELPHL